MRAVLRRCGYVQEAHYRRAWPGEDGVIHDGIGYALLREDWERWTTTPVDWDGG
jgi:RimJ/RimL family protein N-acetyltransferase